MVAVIQPANWADAGGDALMAFARANLSQVKSERKSYFMQELPRRPTGKLYKRLVRDAPWGKQGSRIV